MGASAFVSHGAAASTVGTTFAPFSASGALDVVLPVTAGDVIEVGVCAQATAAASVYRYFDVAVMVSGSPVRWVSSGTSTGGGAGMYSLFQASVVGGPMHESGSKFYTVQAGDIVGGNITLRLYGRASSLTLSLAHSSTLVGQVWASVCTAAPVSASLSGTISTSWGMFANTVTVAAGVGDVLAIAPNIIVNPTTGSTALFDAVTVVSGARVNAVSSGTSTRAAGGVSAWRADLDDYEPANGTALYVVQSGDVVSGNVTIAIDAISTPSTRTLDGGSSFSVRKAA